MKSEEFDKRIEQEDVFELFDNPKVMSIRDFQKKRLSIEFSQKIYSLLEKKAKELDMRVEDLIKVIVAERMGVL
ncbi:MAG: hypothetical protein C6H99_04090 [Epsilonproteobacteria bacterium]|nr:hypothetical protein [Campylobacterota bacterium]NPA64501.1 hypothetical protein [Campylobacterota bacterium]